MKNFYLYIKLSDEDTCIASEYADNFLSVDLKSTTSAFQAKEYTLRVYSSAYHFLGTDTVSVSQNKSPKSIHFDIQSMESWQNGIYCFYVFCNGRPEWFACHYLYTDYCYKPVSAELRPITELPTEFLFAHEICMSEWWETFDNFGFQQSYVTQFIHHVQLLSLYKKQQLTPSFPCFFVFGKERTAKKFAHHILGKYLVECQNKDILSVSVSEFIKKKYRFDTLPEEIKKHRLALLDISNLCDFPYGYQLVRKLLKLIDSHTFSDTLIIFHGPYDEWDEVKFMRPEYDVYTTAENTFYIPNRNNANSVSFLESETEFLEQEDFNQEENDEDFDELLEDTPSDSDNSESEISDSGMSDSQKSNSESDDSLKEPPTSSLSAKERLMQMIGLKQVKAEVKEAEIMTLFRKGRQEMELEDSEENRNHMIFYGNPGTGKTTVAKLIGEMYHEMGLLTSGHTIETNRSKLVGRYIGETEDKVNGIIESARGGVLFIDEAYTLVHEDDPRDFGAEVLNTLLTVLSEPNPNLIIIFAGYEDKMKKLLSFNEGLLDRFPLKFHFNDYNANELFEIALDICHQRHYTLTESANRQLYTLIETAVCHRDIYFGNGRWVHNLVEHDIIKNMAKRVMNVLSEKNPTSAKEESLVNKRHLFSVIEECDVLAAFNQQKQSSRLQEKKRIPIGFRIPEPETKQIRIGA